MSGILMLTFCSLPNPRDRQEALRGRQPRDPVSDEKALDAEVAKHDLVISLIPYTFHALVIKSAIRNKKNVVTTSYVSPAMMELDEEAKAAGITVMNEIGVSLIQPSMHTRIDTDCFFRLTLVVCCHQDLRSFFTLE